MLFLNESTKYINVPGMGLDKEVQETDALVESMGIIPGSFDKYFSSNVEVAVVEILGEMNSGWDALEKDMILCEAHTVIQGLPLNESFSETMKKWWDAIANFFAKIWNAIRGAFQKAWIFITTKFQNAKKWLDANEKDIDPSASLEVEEFDNIAKGTFASLTGDALKPVDKNLSKEDYEKWLKDANENKYAEGSAIREYIQGGKEKKQQTVKIDLCKNIIKQADAWKSGFSKKQAEIALEAKNAIETAKLGQKYSIYEGDEDKKAENERLAAYIKCLKKKLAYDQAFMSAKISAASQAASFAFTCAKKLLAQSKANKK